MKWKESGPTYKETISIFQRSGDYIAVAENEVKGSEFIYAKWVANFNAKYINAKIQLSQLLIDFWKWQKDFPEMRGTGIKKTMLHQFEKNGLDTFLIRPEKYQIEEIEYAFTNQKKSNFRGLKLHLLEQDSNFRTNYTEKIIISNANRSYFVERKGVAYYVSREPRLGITMLSLRQWLISIGISICGTTMTHLWEFGLPYNGSLIKVKNMMHYSTATVGLLGAIAFKIAVLDSVAKSQSSTELEAGIHPLCQPLVLALAELEWHLNPLA